MDSQVAIDLGREAITIMIMISAPVLLAGAVVGLVVGLMQALTQVQEQTLVFVPKLMAMFFVLSLSLPWLLSKLVEYSHDLIVTIPSRL